MVPVPAGLGGGVAAAHHRDVVAGAAHVDAEQIGSVLGGTDAGAANDAAGRPRGQHPDRAAAQVLARHHAAARLHHQQLVLIAGLCAGARSGGRGSS